MAALPDPYEGGTTPSTSDSRSIIEPDSEHSDGVESSATSTRTVRESIFEFIKENGRTYHSYAAGSYNFPNDEQEIERMDLQYEVLKVIFKGKSHFAPLYHPRKALDIGTGTGKWCIDFAREFPNCEVTGTDLSPIQNEGKTPANVRFLIDDANEDDWGIKPASLDYIHTRVMLGAFDDFREVVRKAFYYLKPGGWFEVQEFQQQPFCDDGSMPADWPFKEWAEYQLEAAKKLGKQMRYADRLKNWLRKAGYDDVHEDVFKQPLNPWPRDPQMKMIGRFAEMTWLDGIQGYSMALFHRGLGWNKNEIEVFLVPVRKAISDRNVHAYHKIYSVWGQRPRDPSQASSSSSSRPAGTSSGRPSGTSSSGRPSGSHRPSGSSSSRHAGGSSSRRGAPSTFTIPREWNPQ